MLDTNVVSDLVRNTRGKVARKISEIGDENVCVSIIVVAELRFGCAKNPSERLNRNVAEILSAFEIIPFDSPADVEYARIRLDLTKRGTPIGPNDLLIAAHALALGLPLVTNNTREFSRVPGLALENWLK